jgi:hypothetical protein
MELYERHQFEAILSLAVERFRDRIVQRCEGVENALGRLQRDPEGDGVWLGTFVKQFFADELLDNPAGAAYILQILEKRKTEGSEPGAAGDVLQSLARGVFAGLLLAKTIESLESGAAFGS